MAHRLLQLAKYGHQLDETLHRYKAIFYPQRYVEYRRWLKQQAHSIPNDKPVVVFDFRDTRIDGPQGRRFYCLFIFFVRAGFYPVLRENYFFLGNIQEKFKRLCLQEPFAVLNESQPLPQQFVLVTDKEFSSLQKSASQVISLNYQPGYSGNDACFPMPFPMFPPVYANGQDLRLELYRQQTRRWRIFFGGDAETGKYNKGSIREIYEKLSRAQILQLLRDTINTPDHYCELHSNEALATAMDQSLNGLVVMNTRQCKVDPTNWLGTLALSEFFLACPGVRYPMSHNLIETLAVGSIPITQYPEMFFPALEHGKNCLVFRNETELLAVIQQALHMDEGQRQTLRQGAQDYYDAYLSPKACIQNLLAHHPRHVSLRLLPFLKEGGGYA